MRLRALWLVVGWGLVALIVWASLTPSPPELGFRAGDKVGHLASYAGLMFWFGQLYGARARVAYAAGFVAMGVALELLQGWSGTRSYELYDMLANTLGVALGWGAARLLPAALPGARGRPR